MRSSLLLWSCLLLIGCGGVGQDPCERFFEPYPDLISGRQRTPANANLVDGMTHYSAGRFAEAIPLLEGYSEQRPLEPAPQLYLAVAYLANSQPFKAELTLDRMEQMANKSMADQVDRYNLMCLLCSGQSERARQLAKELAAQGRHTYKEEFQSVLRAL